MAETKEMPFRKRHFQVHFLEWKYLYSDQNCTEVYIPALVQTMAWRRPGNKPLSEPMVISFTLRQWVKTIAKCFFPVIPNEMNERGKFQNPWSRSNTEISSFVFRKSYCGYMTMSQPLIQAVFTQRTPDKPRQAIFSGAVSWSKIIAFR